MLAYALSMSVSCYFCLATVSYVELLQRTTMFDVMKLLVWTISFDGGRERVCAEFHKNYQ